MGEHLSWLQVDEIVSGLASEPEHARGCAECRARLDQARALHRRVSDAPEFTRRVQALEAKLGDAGSIPRFTQRFTWAVPVALAAAILGVVLVNPRRETASPSANERLKGGPAVEVRLAQSGLAVTQVRVGDRVGLAVAGAGRRFGLVLAMDRGGAVSALWPASGESGGISPGAVAPVGSDFVATSGSLEILALVTEAPCPVDRARAALEVSAAEARRRGQPLSGANLPRVCEGGAWARMSLAVSEPP